MRGDFGIYLNFVNGNHYQAVFSVAQQMQTIHVSHQMQPFHFSQLMSTVPLFPIVIYNLLSQYKSTVVVSSNVNSMSPSKLATVLSSVSFASPQKRPRGRPQKTPRICLYIFCNCFDTIYFK